MTLSGADYIAYLLFGSHAPRSYETMLDNMECAIPDAQEDMRAGARDGRSHNARGRKWWNRHPWDRNK
jgi:hypothetical protein